LGRSRKGARKAREIEEMGRGVVGDGLVETDGYDSGAHRRGGREKFNWEWG